MEREGEEGYEWAGEVEGEDGGEGAAGMRVAGGAGGEGVVDFEWLDGSISGSA